MASITTTVVGITDQGLVRKNNEDALVVGCPKTGQRLTDNYQVSLPNDEHNLILIVSDGMGGARAGEVASDLTIKTMLTELPRLPQILSPQSRLEAAIEAANLTVWQQQHKDAALAGMGATVVAVLVEQDWAYIATVGDSRAYIIRDRVIKQLTSDQTMIQALLDSGAITPEAALRSRHRNMLLQAVGQQEHLQFACSSMKLKQGDYFLLCSDGLSNKMAAFEIYTTILNAESIDKAAQKLIDTAKERGGEDNITVILAQFNGDGLTPPVDRLSRSIQILAKFDPDMEPLARPLRQIRAATYNDWLNMAVVDYYAETDQQRTALKQLAQHGDYILFRKGDGLVFQGERGTDTQYHYWLVTGRYRVEVVSEQGERKTVAMIVPPTDLRANEEILANQDYAGPVRRQFFTASMAMLNKVESRGATIWCEDAENTAIRVPLALYQEVAEILGSRFLNAVHNS